VTWLDYDAGLGEDHSPRHLDPGGRGVSCGRTLLVTFPHLVVGEDHAEGSLTKEKEASAANSGGELPGVR